MTISTLHCFKQRAWKISGLLAVLIVVSSVPVWAQSDWDMQNRIKRLENEIDTLSRAVYRGEKPPPGGFSDGGVSSGGADVEIRLQQIETEMRDLRGQLEQQSFEIRQMKDQLERFTSDVELRMNDLEGQGGGQRSGGVANSSGVRYTAPSSVNTGDLTDSSAGQGAGPTYQWSSSNNAAGAGQLGSYTASGNSGGDMAAAIYENAFAMVKNRQYKAAQTEFESFLRDYPDHALASNARYWLGETHYVRGEFESAARVFAEGYQKDPKGSKAGDNLLKLGLSLDALGKREDACVALRQLKKENPAGAAPVLRRADQEMSRLGC